MSAVIKTFFSLQGHNCGVPQIFFISTDIFTKKKHYIVSLFFFVGSEANLEAASLACIYDFDKNA